MKPDWRSLIIRNQKRVTLAFMILMVGLALSPTALTQVGQFFHLLPQNSYPPFTWTGAGGNANWNTAGNWNGSVVPGASDVAHFIQAACTPNCNATINASISVKGVDLDASYTGTITQGAGNTITIGTSGWVQAGGTFTGGSSAVNFNVSSFSLSGGTYTASSGTTTFSDNTSVTYSAGTFNHNNGAVKFDMVEIGYQANKTYTFNVTAASMNFYNLTVQGYSNYEYALYAMALPAGQNIVVENTFTFGKPNIGGYATVCMTGGGTVQIKGNLVVPDSTCANSNNSGTFLFNGTGNQTYSWNSGAVTRNGSASPHTPTIPAVVVNKPSGTLSPAVGTTDWSVQAFTLTAGTFDAPTGTLRTRTNFTVTAGTYNHNNGTLGFDGVQTGYGAHLNYAIAVPGASFNLGSLLISGASDYVPANFSLVIPGGVSLELAGNLSIQKTNAGWSGNLYSNTGTINVAGSITMGAGAAGGSTVLNVNGTGAQSLTQSAGTVFPSTTLTINKASGAATATTNIALSTAGKNLTISAGTVDMAGFNLSVNSTLTVSAGATLVCNGGTLTAGTIVNNGTIDCASYPFNWTGGGGNSNWNTAGNWQGGAVPGASHVPVFKDTYCGANCNATMNVAVNIKGMQMLSGYTGTITQGAGNTVTIGTSGWTQAGGTFAGGNSTITNNSTFNLSGGTFTSTSGTYSHTAGFTISGGTFNHNSGTLKFDNHTTGSGSSNITLGGALDLWNLQYAGGFTGSMLAYGWNLVSGSFNVLNQFRIGPTEAGATGPIIAYGGTINLKGNLVIDPATQYGTSTATHSTSLIMDGTGAQTYSAPSDGYIPSLTINKASGSVAPVAGTHTFCAQSFTLTAGSFTAPSGTLYIVNDFTQSVGTTFTHNSGTIQFDNRGRGTPHGTSTITVPTSLALNNLSFGGGFGGSSANYYWSIAAGTTLIAAGDLWIGRTKSGASGYIYLTNGAIEVGGNLTAAAGSGSSGTGTTLLLSGATSKSISQAGIPPGGDVTITRPGATTTLLTNTTFNTGSQDLTVTSGTLNMAGYNLTVNGVVTVGTNGILLCNGGLLSRASLVNNGVVDCAGVSGFNWTGLAGDGNWNSSGNWSNSTVPGASDIAVFGSQCSGAACNATINVSSSVKGLVLTSSYSGTLTQGAGSTLTVGTSGWTQAAGTFAGGSSAITLNGDFNLSGGTFTSTSGTLTANLSFNVSGSPNFSHNSGTVVFAAYNTYASIAPNSVTFNNLSFSGHSTVFTMTGSMTVDGTLTINDDFGGTWAQINGGTINAKGNVTAALFGNQGSTLIKVNGSTNQTLSGIAGAIIPNLEIASTGGTVTLSGTLQIRGNYTFTSGSVTTTGSTLYLDPYGTTASVTPGAFAYNNVKFVGGYSSFNLNAGAMTVNGTLDIGELYSDSHVIDNGTIIANGNVNLSNFGYSGTGLLKLTGAANQTIAGVATAEIPNLEIASTGGTVSFSGTLAIAGSYTYTSGVVNASGSTLLFSNYSNPGTVTPGVVAYNNVTFAGGYSSFTVTGTMTVNGTLTIGEIYSDSQSISTGTLLAKGDVVINNYGYMGTGLIKLAGAGNQNVSGLATSMIPNLEIASTGGTVTFSGTVAVYGNYTFTSGTVDASTATLLFNRQWSGANVIAGTPTYGHVTFGGYASTIALTGTMKVGGTLTLADASVGAPGSMNTGTLQPQGNVVFASGGYDGNSPMTFAGATSTTLSIAASASRMTGTVTVNKTGAGSVTLLSNSTFNSGSQDFTITSGTLDLSGYTLTIADALTVDTAGTLICNGGAYSSVSLTNNGTIDCAGYAFNWKGGSGTNWNTAANWTGGVVPDSTKVVVFKDAYCGATCNSTITADPNVKGVRLLSGYTGTITQNAGVAINIGNSGWGQAGGTFTGSDANITVTLAPSSGQFSLTGGTFTSTSATLQIGLYNSTGTPERTVAVIGNSATFNHSNGTIKMKCDDVWNSNSKYTLDVGTALTTYNLISDAIGSSGNGHAVAAGQKIIVQNDLTISSGLLRNGGGFELYGNLAMAYNATMYGDVGTITMKGSGNQTYTATNGNASGLAPFLVIDKTGGTVTAGSVNARVGKLIVTQGTFTAPTGILKIGYLTDQNPNMWGSTTLFSLHTPTAFVHNGGTVNFAGYDGYFGNASYTLVTNGTATLNNVIVEGYSYASSGHIISAGDTIQVSGSFTHTSGMLTGALELQGNAAFNSGSAGPATISFTGGNAQSISGSYPTSGNWTVDKSAGSATLANAFNLAGAGQSLTITNGTLDMAGYGLTVNSNITNNGTLQRGLNPSCGTLSYGGTYSGSAAICP